MVVIVVVVVVIVVVVAAAAVVVVVVAFGVFFVSCFWSHEHILSLPSLLGRLTGGG